MAMVATAGDNRCPFGLKLPLLNAVPTHGPCRFSPTVVLSDFGSLENFCGFWRNGFLSHSREDDLAGSLVEIVARLPPGVLPSKATSLQRLSFSFFVVFVPGLLFPTTWGFNFFGSATFSVFIFLHSAFSSGSRTGFSKASGTSTTSRSSSTPRTRAPQRPELFEGATPSTFPFVLKPNMLEDFRPKLFVFHFCLLRGPFLDQPDPGLAGRFS